MNNWVYLGLAIVSEVLATASLKSTEGFTRLVPSIVVLVGYSAAFYFLSLTLDTIPHRRCLRRLVGRGRGDHHPRLLRPLRPENLSLIHI